MPSSLVSSASVNGLAMDSGEALDPSPVMVASVDTVERPPVPEPVPAPMAVLTAVFSVSVKSPGGLLKALSPIELSDSVSCASVIPNFSLLNSG